jgi:hypothetical protein
VHYWRSLFRLGSRINEFYPERFTLSVITILSCLEVFLVPPTRSPSSDSLSECSSPKLEAPLIGISLPFLRLKIGFVFVFLLTKECSISESYSEFPVNSLLSLESLSTSIVFYAFSLNEPFWLEDFYFFILSGDLTVDFSFKGRLLFYFLGDFDLGDLSIPSP